jgi:hypothetical protein
MSIIAKIRTPRFISGLTGACMMLASCHAWSWGHTGHVEIGRIAIDKLPDEIPLLLRNDLALAAIGELGPEADESKTTGIVTGVSTTGSLLTSHEAFDTAQRTITVGFPLVSVADILAGRVTGTSAFQYSWIARINP